MYHHYLQKGITPEYIDSLNYLQKQFYIASLDIELAKENKRNELQVKALKDERAYAVVTL